MSELSSFDDLAARLARETDQARDQEITQGAQLAMISDLRMERSGDSEHQLADAIGQLHDQLGWLHEHPLRRRMLGRTAIEIVAHPNPAYDAPYLATPLMLEQGLTAHGDHVIRAGYVFMRPVRSYTLPAIHIERAVEDLATGASKRERAYDLSIYQNDLGPKVHVENEKFAAYRVLRKKELIDQYRLENPWTEGYTISEGVCNRNNGKITPMKTTRTFAVDSAGKAGETVAVKGWVNSRRDHGGLIFIDLRDHTGLVQLVIQPDTAKHSALPSNCAMNSSSRPKASFANAPKACRTRTSRRAKLK
jgi:hypothetical protein